MSQVDQSSQAHVKRLDESCRQRSASAGYGSQQVQRGISPVPYGGAKLLM